MFFIYFRKNFVNLIILYFFIIKIFHIHLILLIFKVFIVIILLIVVYILKILNIHYCIVVHYYNFLTEYDDFPYWNFITIDIIN